MSNVSTQKNEFGRPVTMYNDLEVIPITDNSMNDNILGFVEPDRAIVLDGFQKGARGTFIRDGAGAIEWLRWGHRLHRRREP